jgi:hypothetical protein
MYEDGVGSPETLGAIYQTTQRHIPEDGTFLGIIFLNIIAKVCSIFQETGTEFINIILTNFVL